MLALGHIRPAAGLSPQAAIEQVSVEYRQMRWGKREVAGTNVHFEKAHNEHIVASLVVLHQLSS